MNETNGKKPQVIGIKLKRAPDDPAERDPGFQAELQTFGDLLDSAGIHYSQRTKVQASATVSVYQLAEYVIKNMGPTAIGVVGTAIGAWINGRSGRKVSLKIGNVEVEARTIKEVEQLLQQARTFEAGQEDASDEA